MTQLEAGTHVDGGGRPHPVRARRPDRWAMVAAWFLLVLHALRRHPWLGLTLWASVFGLSIAGAKILPRRYEVQSTIQAHRTQVMSSLVGRPSASESDGAIKLAEDTILRTENLVALIKKTDLIARWKAHRAPVVRWKDALVAKISRPPSEKDLIDGFVKTLERRLWVKHTDTTLTVGAEVPDPDLAMDLVSAAMQSFLDSRSRAEIDAIGDVIGILESRASDAHTELERSLAELERLRGVRATKLGKPGKPMLRAPTLSPDVDPETQKLIEQVQTKQQAIADMEDFRRRRTTELQSQLEEQRALYTDPHPAVLDIHQNLVDLKGDSPQLELLKRELIPLQQELRRRGFAPSALPGSRATEAVLRASALEPADPREDEDPDIEYQKADVRHALSRYNEMLGRVETARLEQDSARAAFKFRYVVIRPVERPKGPVWPKLPLVALAGAVGGLAVALFGAALLDLGSRRILEPWQVELQARVPLVGELDAL